MLEGLPIMLALCFMLWHAYYAQNYAGIIDAGLLPALPKIAYAHRFSNIYIALLDELREKSICFYFLL